MTKITHLSIQQTFLVGTYMLDISLGDAVQ